MLREGSLLLYKGRPALALSSGDKAEIRVIGGESLKVREKDVLLLHPGPLKSFDPEAALASLPEGDYGTARSMLEGGRASPAELAELVYGRAGPAEIWGVVSHSLSGEGFFVMDEAGLCPLDDESIQARAKKRREREEAGQARSAFVARARPKQAYRPEEGDARFLQEIEARAAGAMQSSLLLKEIGLEDSPEAAHDFLLRAGVKGPDWNPHPLRLGLSLRAPQIALGEEGEIRREDLRGMEALAIDNAWSRDPDDAVSLEGGRLWVHVADPAAAVASGSPADLEARGRAATLYLPELTSPMLPEEALERYGLGLAASSPAVSFGMDFDDEGQIREVTILRSMVRVRRLSYEEADAALASPPLAGLDILASRNAERRAAAGAVDISLPEARVLVRDGVPEIIPLPKTRSADIVRECMLLAGEAAARYAFREGIAIPYYGQGAPGEAGPETAGDGMAAHWARRRLMKAGSISGSPVAHQGLGLSLYTQATSSLRRYQDLLVHRQLCASLPGGRPGMSAEEIVEAAAMAQARAAQARLAERLSLMHWKIVWLMARPDASYQGIAVGQAGRRTVFLIPELAMETQVAIGRDVAPDEQLVLVFAGADLARLEARFQPAS